MEQNIDNRHKEILWDLLANPAENGQLYKHNLERLVQDNPQSGLLQVMYARSGQTPDIRKASAYFSPKTLYKILHDAEDLLPVARERINKGLNGSNTAEPENYFNIGPATEAEDNATRPVTIPANLRDESVVAPSPLDAVENLPAFEESKTEQIHILAPPQSAAENIGQPATPVIAAATGVAEELPPPIPVAEEPKYTPPTPQYSSRQDDEDEEDNPWDFSKLEETKPAEVIASAEPEPVVEQKPEPVAIAPEPVATAPVTTAAPVIAIIPDTPAAAELEPPVPVFSETHVPPSPGVSAFDTYQPENVFHKQDHVAEEVYNEIVSIDDIGVEGINNTFATDEEPDETEEYDAAAEDVATQQSFIDAETEKLIYGNIAATDYLSFDKKLDELRSESVGAAPEAKTEAPVVEQPVAEAPIKEAPAAPAPEPEPVVATPSTEKEQDVVSKYNDDTMPYSFMWWLDKTRKEHAGAYQPYAPAAQNNAGNTASNELQQQYFANIFSLTSVSSIGDIEPPQVEFNPAKKEDVIIERFIQTDPQIKPLSPEKLDNENKAKRSSEDQDAMVTETLARIYGDQMLYHKAIATYKKLMLKIPEKKLYFAAQIEQLEKKIN